MTVTLARPQLSKEVFYFTRGVMQHTRYGQIHTSTADDTDKLPSTYATPKTSGGGGSGGHVPRP